MKKIYYTFALFLLLFTACRKDKNNDMMYGTVFTHDEVTYYIIMKDPDQKKQAFLCDEMFGTLSSFYPNCAMAVAVTNLPPLLTAKGTKIKFSQWQYKTVPSASSRAPRSLEVYDARRASW